MIVHRLTMNGDFCAAIQLMVRALSGSDVCAAINTEVSR